MTENRLNSIEINKEEFQKIGHQLIDDISDFISNIDKKPVTFSESPSRIQGILGNTPLPESGKPAAELISRATELLFNHSLTIGIKSCNS